MRVETTHVPLAQLDRAFGYEPKGRGFESLKARQQETVTVMWLFFVFADIIHGVQNILR